MKTPSLVTSCCLTAVSNAARFVYLKKQAGLTFFTSQFTHFRPNHCLALDEINDKRYERC